MSFLAPIFFWSFLVLIPLAGIYFLKVRPTRKKATALFLWKKVFFEKQSNSLFKRLRHIWSLLLMVAAFCLAILALTKPEFDLGGKRDLVIVIDESVSMLAKEGGETRLDLAKVIALEMVGGVGGTQRAAIVTLSSEMRYRTYLTDHPRELTEAIESIEGTVLPLTQLSVDALHDLKDVGESSRVFFITDGCSAVEEWPENVELVKVGERQGNVGLVTADLRYVPGGQKRVGFYFQVASSYEKDVEVDVVLSHKVSGRIFKVIPLTVSPGVNSSEVYYLDGAMPGEWLARIKVDDALDHDNFAYLVLPEARSVKVRVLADDPYFFQHSIAAFSGDSGLLELVDRGEDLVVSHGRDPGVEMLLLFQPQGESSWWKNLGDELDLIMPKVAVESHPIVRHVDVERIPFLGAKRLEVPKQSVVLVESEEGVPLIYTVTEGERSAVVVNMDPAGTDFYFSAWFPVLVYNVALFLAGREDLFQATYRSGSVVHLSGSRLAEDVLLNLPTGEQAVVSSKQYGPVKALGFYSFENESGKWFFSSSLLAANESLLKEFQLDNEAEGVSGMWSIAYWLTVFAIFVLVAESILYDRRMVG